MYSENESAPWIIFGLIFGLLPYLVYNLVQSFYPGSWTLGFAALAVLIVGPTFGMYQAYRESKELTKDGAWTKAVVIEKKYENSKHTSGWLIQCTFIVEGKNYKTSFKSDPKNKSHIGDSIDLIYSQSSPKIYKTADEWRGNNDLKK